MKELLKLAFRNIFRNPRRTGLTAFLIGVGLACLMITDGLVVGTTEAMIRSATSSLMGEGQVHHPDFRKEMDVNAVIKDWPKVESILKTDARVRAYAPRVIAPGMISSSQNVASVSVYGIDPKLESAVSKLKAAVVQGEFLMGTAETEIVIGTKLAELLEAGIGDRIVLTVSQAGSGELSQELFRVSGIFKMGSRQMDQGMALVPITRARKMLNLTGQTHEVALNFKVAADARNSKLDLWENLSATGNEALNWMALMPALSSMIEMSEMSLLIVGIILFAVISLGVINSMFMSLYERMYEFGVIKALGTRPRRILAMILLEASSLALLSIGVGLVVGSVFNLWLSTQGLDYSGIEYAGTTIQEPVRSVISLSQYTKLPLIVFALTLLAGLYPAIFASRLVPTRAMRRSL